MKKALPYILIAGAIYYFWWKKSQSMVKMPILPIKPEDLPLETEDGSPLIKYGGGKKMSGIPTIF